MTGFLSHPERDPLSNTLQNTVCVMTSDGSVAGNHRRINSLQKGCESWPTPGERVTSVSGPPFSHVGTLICADAYTPVNSQKFRRSRSQHDHRPCLQSSQRDISSQARSADVMTPPSHKRINRRCMRSRTGTFLKLGRMFPSPSAIIEIFIDFPAFFL